MSAIALSVLVTGSACGGKRVRTPYMEKADQVTATAAELRVYLYDTDGGAVKRALCGVRPDGDSRRNS